MSKMVVVVRKPVALLRGTYPVVGTIIQVEGDQQVEEARQLIEDGYLEEVREG